MNISGKELYHWQQQAKGRAIADCIDPHEVDWLLQTVTNLSSLSLRLGSWQHQSEIECRKSLLELNQLWQQRLQERIPVQYLVETVFWRRFQLKVTPAVLIPRPETELIIDLAQTAREQNNLSLEAKQNWVDLGTGSGAIALGLAASFPQATIHAVDVSCEALNIAQENAINCKLSENIRFYQGSWWQPLKHLQAQVTGMVSNPPYIPTAVIEQLQPEVVKHEPHLALDGGKDGLDAIRYLVQTAPQYLIKRGIWLIEIMQGQAPAVVNLLQQQGEYEDIQVFQDLSGIERFILAFKK
ncbi:protein-(glutamine-N5) methyltransferase, release factor-specific [Chondrocystis sp. NIES-4102]|nr:protein-(glutamine-N5) methyltransferase, release factor-specific [Chondrocystis sp. NIES-4102]